MGLLTSRAYTGEEDVRRIADLVRAVRPRERAGDYPTVADLPQALKLQHNQSALRLWFCGPGQLAAYAFVDNFETLRFDLDPAHRTPELEAELIGWADACALRAAPVSDPAPEVVVACHSEDAPRLGLLTRLGFVAQAETVLHLERPLANPIDRPVLPAGFRLRPLTGQGEAAAAARLHRAAYGTDYMTGEHRLELMREPEYDPSLDLVVAAPNGELAAYAMGVVRADENALTGRNGCYTDLFGTHPNYQGRGLALALLLALLRALQPRGYEFARLTTTSSNLAMQRVAAKAGFSVTSQTLLLVRTVRRPAPLSPP